MAGARLARRRGAARTAARTCSPTSHRTLVGAAVLALLVTGGGIALGVSLGGDDPAGPPIATATAPYVDAAAAGTTDPATTSTATAPTDTTPTSGPTGDTDGDTSGAASAPLGIAGTWSGAVYGSQDGFDVVVDLVDGRQLSGTVSYPQLGCTGTWQEQSRDSGHVFLLEQISSGPCVRTDVELTLFDDSTLGFRSSWSDKAVYATLRR